MLNIMLTWGNQFPIFRRHPEAYKRRTVHKALYNDKHMQAM